MGGGGTALEGLGKWALKKECCERHNCTQELYWMRILAG